MEEGNSGGVMVSVKRRRMTSAVEESLNKKVELSPAVVVGERRWWFWFMSKNDELAIAAVEEMRVVVVTVVVRCLFLRMPAVGIISGEMGRKFEGNEWNWKGRKWRRFLCVLGEMKLDQWGI